jgi:hypothetical protein
VERMNESIVRGRVALESPDPGGALFEPIDQAVGRQQNDRALFEALDDAWLANDDIRAVHSELIDVLDALVQRAQAAGAVRDDISAVDVLMMIKGVCEACASFQQVDPGVAMRQLDLVRAAISAPGIATPLRGQPPTLEDLERVSGKAPVAAPDRATG